MGTAITMTDQQLARLSVPTEPRPKRATTQLYGVKRNNCKKRCPGDRACCLRGDVAHSFCVCRDEGCWCHSQERYEGR